MAPTSSRPKITSSSFGLSTTGERLGGKKTTIKISSLEKSSLKNLVSINNTLDSILNTLTGAQKEDKKLIDKQRKEEESKKRSEREKGLESKVFDGIKTAVSTVMKPFTSIWDWITNFFFNVFLGKVVIKLLNWFSDPKNKDKIQSIVRFFKDWWPTMLGAYILFGTSFGRLARGLVGIAGKSVIGLGKVIYRLITAIGKGKALKAAGALSGGRGGPGRGGGRGLGGALLRGGLLLGGSLLAGAAIDKGVEAFTGGGEEEQQAKIDVPDSPEIPMLNAATGGLADIGKIFGKFGGDMMGGAMGSMFGPLGMLMGSMMGGNLPNIFQGLVSGKKGTDKIPAMLTDGEFVMSKGAVQKYGVDTLESMNAAGGGTNIPKIVKGVPHAAGGGYIGSADPYNPNQMSEIDFRKYVDGRIEERMADRRIAELRGSRSSNLPELDLRRSNTPRINPNRMLPAAGQSSANAMRASRNIRSPIPASSAIVPYSGGLARTGVTGGLSATQIPQIRTNMNVPGGFGNIRSLGVEMLASYLIDRGFDKVNAMILAKKIDEGKKLTGDKKQNYIERLSNVVVREERWQKGLGGIFDSIIGMGKESSSQKLSKSSRAILEGMGSDVYQDPRDKSGGGFLQPGGLFGGPRMSARMDYAASKDKYYSSSDQKTYGNYNDAEAARKSRLTSLTSQQRLNKLSSQGAGPRSGMGIRYRTEAAERNKDFDKRGGLLGQMGRGFTRMFGSGDQISKLDKEDRAANIKVKQAGAASIGRYYSSSDGKYYKDYNAAKLARDQRRRAGAQPPVKPKPKYNPAGGGMGGARGGGSGSRPAGNTPPVGATSGSAQSRQSARQKGIGK